MVKPHEIRITANGDYLLGVGDNETVQKLLVQVQSASIGADVLKLQKKLGGAGAFASLADCAYRDELAKSEETAGTALVAGDLVSVELDGCEVSLNVTLFDTAITVLVRPVRG